jgi:hypothetical protein
MHRRSNRQGGFPPWQIARTLALLALTRLGLRCLGFNRSYRLIARLSARPRPNSAPSGSSLARARRTAETVTRINRDYALFGASCLEESLFLWGHLRRRGIPADFRIGVRTLTGTFESHAWVELDGIALNDIDTVGQIYTPIDPGQTVSKGQRP